MRCSTPMPGGSTHVALPAATGVLGGSAPVDGYLACRSAVVIEKLERVHHTLARAAPAAF